MNARYKIMAVIICAVLLFSIVGYFLIGRIFFDNHEDSTIDFTDRTDNTAWYGYLESNNDSFLYTGSPEKFKENMVLS